MKNQKLKIYLFALGGILIVSSVLVFNQIAVVAHEPPPPQILPCFEGYNSLKGTFYDDFTICQIDEDGYVLNDRTVKRNDNIALKYQWSELTKVGEYSTSGTLSVFVSGQYAYLGGSQFSESKFIVVDISNQNNPSLVSELDFSGEWVKEVNDLFVSGNYAYLAITTTYGGYSTYLKIIDISNPSSPTTTVTYESYPSLPEFRTEARKIFVSGNYAFVIWKHGLEIINVSDKENPQLVYLFNSLSLRINYFDLFVEDNYLYVSFEDNWNQEKGIKIYNVANPSEPEYKGQYLAESFTLDHLYLENKYLYFNDNLNLIILDVSSSSEPSLIKEIDLSFYFTNISDIFINKQKLFIIGQGSNYGRLMVFDVSDPSNPLPVTQIEPDDGGLTNSREIFVSADSSMYIAPGSLKIYRYGFLTSQDNQGQITTFNIDPLGAESEIGSWDRIELNNTVNNQAIIYQILDQNNNLIPDEILPGNSVGFVANSATTTIDIHNIPVSAYPKLKLKGSFYTDDSFDSPSINSWKVYWIKARGSQSANQVNVGQTIYFDASDSIGDSLVYKWDFDKSNGFDWNNPDATGAQVSHIYQSAGIYIATLRIQQGTATAINEKEFTITVSGDGSGGGGGGGGGGVVRYLNRLTLSSSTTTLIADGDSVITLFIQLYDQYNDILVTSPIIVNFSLDNQTFGTLSSLTCLTNNNGQCQITFKAADKVGRVKITACAATDVCGQIEINLIPPPETKAEIVLTKTVDPESDIYPGQILTYRIDYKNKGNKSTILTIQDQISLGTSYVPNSLIIDGQPESDEAQPIFLPMPLPKYGDFNQTEPNIVTFYLSLVEPNQEGYVSYQVKVDEDYLEKYYYDLCRNCQCLIGPIEGIKPINLERNYFRIQTISRRPEILPIQPIYCPQDCSPVCYSSSSIINQAKGFFDNQIVYSNLVSSKVIPKTNLISKINLIAEPKELLADGQSRANLMACVSTDNEFQIQAIAQPPVILPILPDLSGIQIYLNIIEGGGKLIFGAKSYLTDKNGCVYETYQSGNKAELIKIKAEVNGKLFPIEVKKVGSLYDIEEINLLPLPPVCGNNIKERNEQCDGIDLGGKTCLDFGYSAGQLKCKSNCLFDTSQCISFGGGGPGGPGGEIPGQEQPIQEQPPRLEEELPVIEEQLPLEEKPLTPEEVVPTRESVVEKIIGLIGREYQKIRTNRTVQNVNKNAVVPIITVGAAINLASSLPSTSNVPILLQYLLDLIKIFFTQPILLLAARRKQWGTIYNSLTKYPISLAAVRLYEITANQKKLVQTKITGPDGRYFFLAKPGQKYKIEVSLTDYIFPTNYLKDKLTDEPFNNLYFGQEFITSEGLINFNIPLDPKENRVDLSGFSKKIKIKPGIEEKEEYNLVVWEAKKRRIFLATASIAPILSLVCFIISPSYYTGIIFVIQSIIWVLFRNFSRTIKPKQWGKTFEIEANKKLPQVMVRLFAKPFNKLVAVQISDQLGRYGFLVSGEGEYYLVPVKPNYIFPQEKIEISAREIPFIAKDLGMKKEVKS